MALPKNNTSGVPTTDYAGPGAGMRIMKSDDPIAAAKAANEAYRAANPTGMDSNISPTYYTPTMQGEEDWRRGELRSLLSQYYDPSMQGMGNRGELQSLLAQLLQGYGMPSDQRGEISPLIRNLLIGGGNTAFSPSQRARASAQRQQQEAASFLPIRSMAGGGTIDKPTMAVVGEAGPELALLQPGDAIFPLSMPQANQLLKAGTPGFQRGTGVPADFLGLPAETYIRPVEISGGGRRGMPRISTAEPKQPTSVIQLPAPEQLQQSPFQTGGSTRTVMPATGPTVSYVPPGPEFRPTPAPGISGGPFSIVPIEKEPEPLPPFQWADGAGINSAELLKASRAGQYTPAMAAEVLETLSDVTADVEELESELALLEADEDIELNDPRIIQKRQDLNDARRVFAEVQQVYETANANQENFLSRQITETQFGREADIRERERQEDYERQLAATELQYGRSQEEDAEILARQSAQNEAVANLLTQLFGSIGITIPEEAKGALTTQNLSSLLGTFMNLQQQQQQQATPQVARLGFA